MYSFTLIFVCIFQLVKNEESPFSRKTLEESWEEQLMKDLSSKHTSLDAPNATNEIDVHFILKYFTLGEDESTFTAYSWIILSWNDPRLKWNETDYNGVSEVIYNSYKFWGPSLRLLNEVDWDDYDLHHGFCSLDKTGDITCIPRVRHEAPCQTIMSNWPYDIQKCSLQIGFFTVFANVKLKERKKFTSLLGAEYGNEWTIIHNAAKVKSIESQIRKLDNGSRLDLTFFLIREGEGLGAIVVFPTILLTILTVCSFLLSVKENLRLGIICFNLLCHFLFITELNELIPKHSKDYPTILFCLRDSLMINIMLVILTMILISLRKRKVPVPSWISDINRTVLKSEIGFLVWPRWEVELKKGASEEIQTLLNEWADFTDILNTSCLWIVIFLYVYFLSMYIPRSLDYDESIPDLDWP